MTTEQIVRTLMINIISIPIGGGLIGLWIDWRRHLTLPHNSGSSAKFVLYGMLIGLGHM